ncbi:DUF2345 domain-containing protein [Chromobacterium phragmitis]|uniref:Uncharacterized protein n=1 Tax=Chromobacterium phragmitis TaxID=2202141 RepID=A0A344UG89_9NEIS|nr:DUF2345 domain-containing protein [Chromobacterium phragmitis]AXE33491.1 hypothetical protein DK843_03665 [Chromobacterium phragmitis]AXE34287.1 hypothetical protein DK843_08260 [Chromobacterium phragmitis]
MEGGGYIRISGGNIEIHCPGTVSIRGQNIALSGPAQIGMNMNKMPSADLHSLSFVVQDAKGNIQKNMPYIIKDGKGKTLKGITDKYGRTQRIHTSNPNDLSVQLDHGAMGNHLEN